MIVVSSKDRVRDLDDLSFCEQFHISLNRVRLNGKRGISQNEFAQHVGISASAISKEKNNPSQGRSKAGKEMQNLIDRVL